MGMLAGSGGGAPVIHRSTPHPQTPPHVVAAQAVSHAVAPHVAEAVRRIIHSQTVPVHHGVDHNTAVHTPSIRAIMGHGAQAQSPLTALLAAIAAHAQVGQQAQPQGPAVWNGQQWVPAPVMQNGPLQQPNYAAPQGPNDAGNTSIASHGGGNGILGMLLGLMH